MLWQNMAPIDSQSSDQANRQADQAWQDPDIVEPPAVRLLLDPVDGTHLVTAPDAARLMGCGLRTVHGWIQRGLVEVRRTPTGQARIVVASLWKRAA